MQLLSLKRWGSTFRTPTGLWLACLLSLAPTLAAAVRTVDDDGPATYSSITAALAAANTGDTIQVAVGTYDDSRETFPLVLKDGVAIIGAGRDTTSIVATDGVSAFANDATPLGSSTRLEGFTIAQEEGDTEQVLMQFVLGDATMSPRIEANRFRGNADAIDGGIIVIAEDEGGVFDGTITGNEFRGFGSFFSGAATQAVSTSFPGAVAMGRDLTIEDAAKAAVKSNGLVPVAEDRITPTIRGNTFEANAFAIAVIGSSDCSCGDSSGVMAPLIDDNEFIENAFDVLLFYGGFDFREFSPVVSNNTSTYSLVSIGSLPFFISGPPPSSTASSSAVKAKPAQSAEWREILRGLKSTIERGEMREDRSTLRVAHSVRPSGAVVSNLFDVTISGNTITNALFAGMLLYQDMDTDGTITVNAEIRDNAIASTETTLGGIVFGVFVGDLATQLPGSLLFQGNNIDGPADSLVIGLGDFASAPLATSGVKLADAAATDVQIIGNRLENGEIGLQFMSDDYTTLAALVSCNVITNHSIVGVGIEDSVDPTPDFGGGTRSSPGLNSIHDNLLSMDNLDPDEVKAENNYWGTTDGTAVDTSIDGNVDFTPFLTAEPVGCNLIAPSEADLSLVKTVTSTGPYLVGDEIAYTLTVTNNGPATATNVEITDPIPFGTEFVSASAGCTASLVTITCTRPTLNNGSSRSFNIVVRAIEEGQVENIAVADSDQVDPVAGNSVAVATPVTVGAPAVPAIPTTSEWGLLLMSAMLACVGVWLSRRLIPG